MTTADRSSALRQTCPTRAIRCTNTPEGAREAILEKRAIEPSKLEHEEPVLPPRYVSTYKNDFVAKDLPPSETLGRKVMMTQNMVGIKGAGDGLYRKEYGIIPANRFPGPAEPCRWARRLR